MSKIFEIIEKDAAGRIGRLKTPHGVVETPTVMPVINPNLRIVDPAEMREFGAEILITNSYIIYSKPELREKALKDGLHELIGFNGPIMTDSGSFQLSVYGDVNVENHEIIAFEQAIGTDIGVPLDIPTAPDVRYDQAKEELQITNERLSEARRLVEERRTSAAENAAAGLEKKRGDDMLLAGPIQGSTYLDLRAESAAFVSDLDFDVYPIGAVVPLMESYRYEDLVNVVAAAKSTLDPTVPVHLFGAGHPMMFALAVALGCDLFDSAAYALYAKGGRYITVNGTYPLERLKYLPCSCPVCSKNTAESIQKAANKEELLARHNLYVTFEEIRLIKQAIHEGKLMELVELRCHSHPQMVSALAALYNHAEWLEQCDPAVKSTFFECSAESSKRPEVFRYSKRLNRFTLSGKVLIRPAKYNKSGLKDADFDHVLYFKPPFGAFPSELEENYPFNAEVQNRPAESSLKAALENTAALIRANPNAEFTFVKGKRLSDFDDSYFEALKEICQVIENPASNKIEESDESVD
ncbi:tRNA guanosine(15) transglycosylase TgtA [Methanimicrococcus blatticola]|uniref:tRNA-guanine(15) transglycosylase n=1 Tax=Methanimicrococcus blatticola TaxID=91560 RepID=A0A484F5N7_9EURY|nr:tRNA guanosine(15) transglycosylase TgtA [Methanimicrococcus blatticola]MBZ3935332.1 tRNA guanosine(15) transglycosylase TgtA [Methanimicrococcus blatticola]MCC2508570.1 tRNA guanosine(15) transglycosylase TgtA [Methanimicrococcus blatticola]TDQ67878.1 archaeosine tRNA-ribosyltransferase [Methanimicrococcus blatticola]